MTCRLLVHAATLAVIVPWTTVVLAQSLPSPTEVAPPPPTAETVVLPSPQTSEAIANLPQIGFENWAPQAELAREWVVEEGSDPTAADGARESLPFVVPNSMIIQFTPNASAEAIRQYLDDKDLSVIQSFPSIGAVQVEADLSAYFAPRLSDTSSNDALLRGMLDASADFKSDALVQSATPDFVLTDKKMDDGSYTNMLQPTEIVTRATTAAGEVADWGITDIEADKLWELPGAHDGVILGIMDAGFARHEDITFLRFPAASPGDNHCNHVAAIACANHNDIGVEGVLPNCFVVARSADVFFQSVDGNPQLRFMTLFSQILATLSRFIDEEDQITTYNISLGYNWRRNFNINPDLPESLQWRQLVEMQGSLLVSVLEVAQRKDKVIFSAAGNDSDGLDVPIGARYASPFNWAAITARETGRAQNGFIIGAHGPDGQRASFSNSGADLSCPGTDILSAVAYDAAFAPSRSAYGKMSGTSMASPYCAAAQVLFRLVRPGYTGIEAVDCLIRAGTAGTDGVPHLKLVSSINACPPRG